MKIGIGTYALFWEFQDVNPDPLDIPGMIDRAAELGCDVFQICDDPRIEAENPAGLAALREHAEGHGLELELGTRTIDREHLESYAGIAEALGARTLRSMIQAHEIADGVESAAEELRATLPRLEGAGITLALETYEQVSTATLLEVIDRIGSPRVGICLDPANCVAALEHPKQVVEACAAHTVNLHVKDFAFTRQEGWVGFVYTGAPLGDGLLDLDHELGAVYAEGSPSAIVEHWLPWQGDLDATLAAERDWTERALAALRSRRDARTS
ncbi:MULTISPECIES: sugar phosphate isomerase/epimerase family protein [unclassified Brachybacterium]|uniref:sugar phosphate isomerase/epimerase family protein n=1 Tax=unclassified Brachybacterium TaxID=2623841 RepID=UPI00361F41B3